MNMNKENTRIIREMQAELFHKQGQGWFRVVSGSMRPLIDVDDRIFAKLVSAAEIQPRDIVLFNTPEALVTHRVVKIIRQNGAAPGFFKKATPVPFQVPLPLNPSSARFRPSKKREGYLRLTKAG